MKQSVRFFSIGLFTSSVLLFGYYFFFNKDNGNLEALPIDDVISHVESEGYRVITEDEFISYSLLTEEANKEEAKKLEDVEIEEEKQPKEEAKEKDDKKEQEKKEAKKEEEKVKKVVIKTKKGVVSQDIADMLIENNIIDDRKKFLDYLDDNGYSEYIQLGKFEVSSDMSFKEIAEIITTYPGE